MEYTEVMDTLNTLTAVLDILGWIGIVVFGGLIVSALTFVFSKKKKPELRERAKWWGAGFGILLVLLIITVGIVGEQVSAVGDEMFNDSIN